MNGIIPDAPLLLLESVFVVLEFTAAAETVAVLGASGDVIFEVAT